MLLSASIKLCGVSEKGRKELGKEKRKREGKNVYLHFIWVSLYK